MVDWDNLEVIPSAPKMENCNVDWDKLIACPKDAKEGDFYFAPLIGKRVLRATVNIGRIHILHYYAKKFGQEGMITPLQMQYESGSVIPRINPEDNHEAIMEKMQVIATFVETMHVVHGSINRLVVYLNTQTQEQLEKVCMALYHVGVNVKFELAGKDELNTEENCIRWEMFEWLEEKGML